MASSLEYATAEQDYTLYPPLLPQMVGRHPRFNEFHSSRPPFELVAPGAGYDFETQASAAYFDYSALPIDDACTPAFTENMSALRICKKRKDVCNYCRSNKIKVRIVSHYLPSLF